MAIGIDLQIPRSLPDHGCDRGPFFPFHHHIRCPRHSHAPHPLALAHSRPLGQPATTCSRSPFRAMPMSARGQQQELEREPELLNEEAVRTMETTSRSRGTRSSSGDSRPHSSDHPPSTGP